MRLPKGTCSPLHTPSSMQQPQCCLSSLLVLLGVALLSFSLVAPVGQVHCSSRKMMHATT